MAPPPRPNPKEHEIAVTHIIILSQLCTNLKLRLVKVCLQILKPSKMTVLERKVRFKILSLRDLAHYYQKTVRKIFQSSRPEMKTALSKDMKWN